MKTILTGEFLERYESGERNFNEIELQYADLNGRNFRDLTFRNSKMLFCTLRNCSFYNVNFHGCDMFFAAMGGSAFEKSAFSNCNIDYSGFVNSSFISTKMLNCKLSWTAMMNAQGHLEMKGCQEFMVIKSFEELTALVVQKGFAGLEPALQQLDFDMRKKIMDIIDDFSKKFGIDMPKSEAVRAYGTAHMDEKNLGAYGLLDSFVDAAVSRYGEKSAYRNKTPYESGGTYEK